MSPVSSPAHLSILKRMVMIHGKQRPIIEVRADLNASDKTFLIEQFGTESLFRRSAYANGFNDGGLQASPPLVRNLNNFVKNDACPEITVKTLLHGQKYEGNGLWDLLCFEFIAKRSFDALLELANGLRGFESAEYYFGFDVTPDMSAFELDTLAVTAPAPADSVSVPAPVAVGDIERMADAA